jgi:hypothetical protein
MFIAALFTTAKLWNQSRCSTTDEWIKKVWYTMEYYSAIKKVVSFPSYKTNVHKNIIYMSEGTTGWQKREENVRR